MEILLATSNLHKAKTIQDLLDRPVQHLDLDLPEIQAIDVTEVIEQKARTAYHEIGQPVLVEDTSLSVTAWNGLPGALVRWFLETVGNEGICRMLADFEQLEATAETCLGFFDGREFISFSGLVKGSISRTPRGEGGFGWDPIFVPEGESRTFAEMTTAEAVDLRSMS